MQRGQSRLRYSRRTRYRPRPAKEIQEAENVRNNRRQNLGMDMPKKQLVAEALIDLHRRLTALPTRSHERRMIMQETANLYGVSEQTLYRALAQRRGQGHCGAQIVVHRGCCRKTSWSIIANSSLPSRFGHRIRKDDICPPEKRSGLSKSSASKPPTVSLRHKSRCSRHPPSIVICGS